MSVNPGQIEPVVTPVWCFLWHDDNDPLKDRFRFYKAKTLRKACVKFEQFLSKLGGSHYNSVDYEAQSSGIFYDLTAFDNALKAGNYV